MLQLRFMDRLKFFVERQFAKGASFQLLVVAAVIGLISVIGGILVLPLDDFSDPATAIWWAFLRLTDPGYLGDDSGSWQRTVSTGLTIMGYVVFLGALVAILTRWLITLMTDLERGLTPVALRNHIVVLGWTSRTLPLLGELLNSTERMQRFLERHDANRLRLVVLSESVSAEQLQEIRDEPGVGRKSRQVIMRSGLAIQPDALHRVACLNAAAVIVPSAQYSSTELVSSDVETVKALLSIAAQARLLGTELPLVVAELQDVRKHAVVERAYPGPIEVVAGDATVSRLMVQNLLHPGLSEVYNELLTTGEGNEIYVRSGPPMEGLTLEAVACNLPRAIVLGILRPAASGWDVQLLAPSDQKVEKDDRVILMARHFADTNFSEKDQPLEPVRRAVPDLQPHTGQPELHRILILGWSNRVPALLTEFASYPHDNFEVDIVSVLPVAEREAEIRRYCGDQPTPEHRHIEADFMVEEQLRRQTPENYDAVMLLSSDRLASGEEADARAMVGYLQLEDIFNGAKRRPQVLLELSDPDNGHLLDGYRNEMIVSPTILSHVLAQVALRRELRAVLEELFTAGGAEIQFRRADDYPLPASAEFRTVEKTLAEYGELALGVFRARAREDGGHLELNPDRREPLELQPEDRLVVLSWVLEKDD